MIKFLSQALRDFTIRDIFDIAIVAFLLYRLFLLIRHTRAVSLIKGVIALALATVASSYLRLDTTHWILNNIWTVGMLAVVVVFQPELRRALEQLGRSGLFRPSFGHRIQYDPNALITNIVKATSILSKNKIGALIVLERETGIQDYAETGIRIDALVSSELLLNIFIPNTPLHDGAVIIREGRVMAAACYLPLTSNPFIDKDLGTRHRAALGITEDSDALAVVVSEETGTISVAENGELLRHLDGPSLREHLRQALAAENHSSPLNFVLRRANRNE